MLSILSSGREVRSVIEIAVSFIVSVLASVAGHYICKWLDRDSHKDSQA